MVKVEEIQNIAVIGAGFIGPGIAQVFASKGFNVALVDIKQDILDRAIGEIKANLKLMAERGLGSTDEIEAILKRIKTFSQIDQAVANAHIVIEAVTEKLELKQGIFQQLDALCSEDTILSSNTSAISITEIAAKSIKRNRILGTHFWNPPFLIPLVEIIKAKDTSDEAMEITFQVMLKAGKHPVKCLKDVPGFIANRLQHALWREAINIVASGIADAATVDEAIKNSFAIRLPVLGPLENADMVGLDLTMSIHDYLFKYLDTSREASPLLKEKVQQGNLGFKTGKGIYEWSPQKIYETRQKLLEYLIDWAKKQSSM